METRSPSEPSNPNPVDRLLLKHWGHTALRPGQREAVDAVLAGRDVLAVLPTGGGKSLLYQLPPLLLGGMTLVVSPLVALIEDQVQALRTRGIPAGRITAADSSREIDQAWTDAEFGKFRVLYVTPERLRTDVFLARAERLPVVLLAVDEAHCISEWGHDFRPAYRQIAEVRRLLSNCQMVEAPVIGLTATATPTVREDIMAQLAMTDPVQIVRGFDRPNILWSVFREENKLAKLLEIAQTVQGSGIVYAGTRKATEFWAQALSAEGVEAEAYHAGMDAVSRTSVQDRWLHNATRYIVATSAFGMGIDKPNVRVVVHLALPPTLESYYQEAGRAGRDGMPAHAVLLVADGDDELPRALAEEGHPDAATVQAVYQAVGSAGQIPLGTLPADPILVDTGVVAKVAAVSRRTVQSAIERLESAGAWSIVPAHRERALVRLACTADEFRPMHERMAAESESLGVFVDLVWRSLPPEAHSNWTKVDLRSLGRRTGMEAGRLVQGLAFLSERGILDLQLPGDGLRVLLSHARTKKAVVDASALARVRRRALHQLQEVSRYVQALSCRRQFLLAYFGERSGARCGRCDVCLGRHRPLVITPDDERNLRQILDHIERGDARADWLAGDGISARQRDGLGDWLVDEGHVRVVDPVADTLELTPKAKRFRERHA